MEQNKPEKWPTIHTAVSDEPIIDAIKSTEGHLRNIAIKDLLLIAASLAIENDLPFDEGINGAKKDTISYANLNAPGYEEYRHYICAVYYLTKANKSVEKMADVNDMAKNFEDYAHRGLLYLSDKYLSAKDGSDRIFTDFVQRVSAEMKK